MNAATANDWVGELALQHLDAAYNLARWLLGNDPDATDAVHDAYLRAARSAHTYAGGNARAWWLAIVRNCCLANLSSRSTHKRAAAAQALDAASPPEPSMASDVEEQIELRQRSALIERHLNAMPAEFREVLVLREFEELSYREIADVLQVPIGTVMSRLARARAMLQKEFAAPAHEERTHGL